jgi:hypothetical protein
VSADPTARLTAALTDRYRIERKRCARAADLEPTS